MRLVRHRGRNGSVRFIGQYTKGVVSFSLGSQIISNSAFGTIGQTGVQGLAAGASFFPTIGTLGGAALVGRQLKGLRRQQKRFY